MRFSQGKIDESEELHSKALKQYQSTIRNRHHRTADVCHKVAQHCIRNSLVSEALGFIDQALKIWSVNQERFAPEIARTSYLKAKALVAVGLQAEGEALKQSATVLRMKILGAPAITGVELEESHFDDLVTFWSR